MVVVSLFGGLGNQLFQYAFGKALEDAGNEVKFDRVYFHLCENRAYALDHWNTRIEFAAPVGETVPEDTLLFHPGLIRKYDRDCTFVGYWQCEEYFKHIAGKLKQDLTLKTLSLKSKKVQDEIEACNSVFLHVRRTDNLSVRGMAFHGICSLDHQKRAIQYIADRVPDIRLFVFSDDIEWCKANLPFEATFVDHNTTGVVADSEYYLRKTEDGTEHEDLWLMSQCKHGIIATSTFSWWGAWLNPNPDKIVIAPDKWFVGDINKNSHDIIPSNWVKM